IHAEPACAIAIATRTPPERRPSVYRGPEGELLVWVPLPAGFTWPRLGEQDTAAQDAYADDIATDPEEPAAAADHADEETSEGEEEETVIDTPPEHAEQEDERWEEALPLNGVTVGDRVVPALPAATGEAATFSLTTPGSMAAPGITAPAADGEARTNPF